MNKRNVAALMAAMAVMTTTSQAAITFYWGSENALLANENVDFYRPLSLANSAQFDGTPIRTSDNYYMGLFNYQPTAPQLNNLWSQNFTLANPPLQVRTAGSDSAGGDPNRGQFYDESIDATPFNGQTMYSVLISQSPAALLGSATPYAYHVFPGQPVSWTLPPSEITYDLGVVNSTTDWQVIPEPTTAGLGLIAMGLLAARRIRRNHSAR